MSSQAQGFWGIELSPHKDHAAKVEVPFRISMAALTHKQKKDARTSVCVKVDDKEYTLCSLTSGLIEQQLLDIRFGEGEDVVFSVKGKNSVHLTGNYVFEDEYESDYESMEDYEDYLEGDSGDDEPSDGETLDEEEDDEDDEDEDEDEEEEEEEEEVVVRKKENKRTAEAPAQQSKSKKQKMDAEAAAEKEIKEQVRKQIDELNRKLDQRKEKEKQRKEKEKKKKEEEEEKKKQESKVKKLPNGLIIEDVKIGTGATAKSGNRVGMRYIGKLTNGKVFDKNVAGKPFTFSLGRGEVIKGWDIGVAGMKVGGERKLTIPAPLAYGKRGAPPDIPGNATLVFEVKLMSVK